LSRPLHRSGICADGADVGRQRAMAHVHRWRVCRCSWTINRSP
jgi:hypothetical protein